MSAPTGAEPETLPGAQPVLRLLDEVIEATGGQRREGQRLMAAHVAQAFELERHLLVQAGTGTGKSLGYLIPALHKVGDSNKPIIVATATLALQSQIVNRDIPRLLAALEPRPESQAQVAILKGRNNYLCLHKLEGGDPEEDESRAPLVAGPVRMDVQRHVVTVDGVEVSMPLKEFELLEILLRNAGRVMTRASLIEQVWGADYVGDTKTLDVHIKRLRSKIEPQASSPRYVVTVRGLGYKFEA